MASRLHTHALIAYLCVSLCDLCTLSVLCAHLCPCASVCLCVRQCVRLFLDLCYSPSIVKESVEQDADPPAGTNETHSSGLNGQLTIREPL